ncbi:hypothetical protein [Microbacterium sp. AR7-10]|uniref:hypothetical protein n=1 Tax=Microbacterium sp. AR7-10 TaxID=1891970 RepID=UPI0008FCA8EF|nr:hypothetical protein [Microbacterium sp. AR7-10]OIU88664.1 hypothetical protein BFN01_04265 [Microbacterium sp. AR7-10]
MTLLQVRSGGLRIKQSPEGKTRIKGLYVARDGFDGWDDGATMRSDTVSRPQAHGDFDMPGFLSGRLVAMEGWAIAHTRTELENLRDQFIGHGADGGKFDVSIERNDRTLRAEARIAAGTRPSFKDDGTGKRARWSVSWWRPDPRKYQTNKSPDGSPFGPASSLQVFQRGNFPALPVFTITGASAGGYTINGPAGRRIVVTRPLVAGAPHRFEMSTGRLYVGGTRVLGGVARADLFTIPPGLPVTSISITAGQLLVDVDDTFV